MRRQPPSNLGAVLFGVASAILLSLLTVAIQVRTLGDTLS